MTSSSPWPSPFSSRRVPRSGEEDELGGFTATITWEAPRTLRQVASLGAGVKRLYVVEKHRRPIYVGVSGFKDSGVRERFAGRIRVLREFKVSQGPYRVRLGVVPIPTTRRLLDVEQVVIRQVVRSMALKSAEQQIQKRRLTGTVAAQVRQRLLTAAMQRPRGFIQNVDKTAPFSVRSAVTVTHRGHVPSYLQRVHHTPSMGRFELGAPEPLGVAFLRGAES